MSSMQKSAEKIAEGDSEPDVLQVPHVDPADIEWTEAEETAVRRKLDCYLIPLTTLLYLLCFLDRANIGNARIQGMAVDLELTGVRFNWALSVFYITYILFEIPSNMLLKKFGPRHYIPFLVWSFGMVSICTAFVDNFAGLLAARAVLGVFEGGTMPGLAFFLSCFYRRNELFLRIGFFISAAGLAGAFGGLLAAALSKIPAWGVASMRIHTWRNIFFFEGLLTVLIAMGAVFLLANSPAEAKFLTLRERQIAAQRIAREQLTKTQQSVTKRDVKQALTSVHNYTCGIGCLCANILVQGLAVFLPTILADFQWTPTRAQLMTVPPNVVVAIVTVSVAYMSDKIEKRGPFVMFLGILAVTGMAVMRWESEPYVRYMGIFFAMSGAAPAGSAFLSWGINNSAGPGVQAVTSAYIVTLGTLGGLIATWTYLASDAPNYPIGHAINLTGQCMVFVIGLFGTLYCLWENRARAAGKRDHRLANLTEEQEALLGDRHPSFRYIL